MLLRISLALLLCLPISVIAQPKKPARHKQLPKPAVTEQPVYNPLGIIGIRPGIGIDSVRAVMKLSGALLREVREDTLSHSYAGTSVHIYVVDSIMCRLTYMRMAFLVDASNRIRRLTITPRESSIAVGANDDIANVLLLYFGQTWGKPEISLEPPLAYFRWRTGNLQVRGFIQRGYPMWVMEG